MKRIFQTFCDSTTFHGFAELSSSTCGSVRLVWLAFMLSAYGYCGYLIGGLLKLQLTAPTVTEMKFEPLTEIPELYYAPYYIFDEQKLNSNNISKLQQTYLYSIVDMRNHQDTTEFANELSKQVWKNIDQYTGKSFLTEIQKFVGGTFADLTSNNNTEINSNYINPSNFRETVKKLIRTPAHVGQGGLWDINRDPTTIKISNDGVWYQLRLNGPEIGLPQRIGGELYLFKGQAEKTGTKVFSRLLIGRNGLNIVEIAHGQEHKVSIEVSTEQKIKGCTNDAKGEKDKIEKCVKDIVESQVGCCLCNLEFAICGSSIDLCCTGDDVTTSNLMSINFECQKSAIPDCILHNYAISVIRAPLNDGTYPGKVTDRLFDAKITIQFLNAERSLAIYERHRFTFEEALSSVGGFLGLLVGGSVLSVFQLFYFFLQWATEKRRTHDRKEINDDNYD